MEWWIDGLVENCIRRFRRMMGNQVPPIQPSSRARSRRRGHGLVRRVSRRRRARLAEQTIAHVTIDLRYLINDVLVHAIIPQVRLLVRCQLEYLVGCPDSFEDLL